ncbi:hypothetical protein FOCC_FOCC006068 [Frankliniella occidentalis]|nr:hypothetical protein FOCC_FOCC006068 [Frankliniella occidentalis]
MIVEIVKQPDMLDIYPEGLRSFPDPNCHPLVADGLAVLRLDLTEKFECGITKVTNQITGPPPKRAQRFGGEEDEERGLTWDKSGPGRQPRGATAAAPTHTFPITLRPTLTRSPPPPPG